MKNKKNISAKILLGIKCNPVMDYIKTRVEFPEGYGNRSCSHSQISLYKGWAGDREEELVPFADREGWIKYDLFCVTAGSNAGFVQYVLLIKEHGRTKVAVGDRLFNLFWVRDEDKGEILSFLKGLRVNTLTFVETDDRYGWVKDWESDSVNELQTMSGWPLDLAHYPNHGVESKEVIFIRRDKKDHPGWYKVKAAIDNMEVGDVVRYYIYQPIAGDLVTVEKKSNSLYVRKVHDERVEVSYTEVIGKIASGGVFPEGFEELVVQYHIEHTSYENPYKEDYYFGLLSQVGLANVINIAKGKGDAGVSQKLQTWVDAGMTEEESRVVWLHSEKSKCYNHTYFWKGQEVCSEGYDLDSPRTKTIHAL